jgi:cation diffusion facilitator family transporter
MKPHAVPPASKQRDPKAISRRRGAIPSSHPSGLPQETETRAAEPDEPQSSRPVIYVALGCNAGIAAAKFVAAALSGSAAMMAEGIHSCVDIGNQLLLLYGMRRARQPPDASFPFGYGKEVYFWCFVVAIEVFTVGAGVAVLEGILKLQHNTPVQHPLLNYAVIFGSLVFEGSSWLFAVSHFSRTKGRRNYFDAVRHGKDPSRFIVLFEDSAALVGLFIAAGGIALGQLTGNSFYDGIASILIGVVLAVAASWLAYETKGLLVGESANREVVAGIRKIASEIAGIRSVHEVLSMHVGPQFILVAITLEFEAAGREHAIDRLEAALRKADPRIKRVFVRVQKGGARE